MSTHHRRVLHPSLFAVLAVVVGLVLSLAPGTVTAADALGRDKVNRLIKVAAAQKGDPYRYGSEGPNAFDCSGYTRFVFRAVGKTLPRVSHDQYRATRKISRSQARRGDLVFFHSGSKRGRVYHVGIFAGRNRIWHAPSTGKRVHKARIWTRRGVTYGRVR